MARPDIVNEFYDRDAGIVYRVLAYRTLTRAEVVREIQRAVRLRDQRPKRGDFLTFRTEIL